MRQLILVMHLFRATSYFQIETKKIILKSKNMKPELLKAAKLFTSNFAQECCQQVVLFGKSFTSSVGHLTFGLSVLGWVKLIGVPLLTPWREDTVPLEFQPGS